MFQLLRKLFCMHAYEYEQFSEFNEVKECRKCGDHRNQMYIYWFKIPMNLVCFNQI